MRLGTLINTLNVLLSIVCVRNLNKFITKLGQDKFSFYLFYKFFHLLIIQNLTLHVTDYVYFYSQRDRINNSLNNKTCIFFSKLKKIFLSTLKGVSSNVIDVNMVVQTFKKRNRIGTISPPSNILWQHAISCPFSIFFKILKNIPCHYLL